ncbi:MAG TPA: LysM peptidoglycan-binding domain-containing protein [Ilumatobacter sp.]|nr:LysM peptidoglycan-binding domain-containing protein [Ilumatobacter sp.]
MSARTYARRRAVVGGCSALVVVATLVGSYDLLAGSSGTPASAAASRPAGAAATRGSVVARPGDTLWSIAEQHRGDVGIRRYVDALIDLNGGVSIQAGQRVTLP